MKMRSPSLAWNRTARTRDPHLTLPLRRPPRGAERARVRWGEPHGYESAQIDPSFYLKIRGPLRAGRRHAQGRPLSELRQAVRDRHGGGADDVAVPAWVTVEQRAASGSGPPAMEAGVLSIHEQFLS